MSGFVQAAFSPSSGFQGARDKGRILFPIIALTLVTLIVLWINLPIINKDLLAKLQETEQPISIDKLLTFARITAFAGAVISLIIMIFGSALLLLLVNALVQGQAKFKQLVFVVISSTVPSVIGGLVTAALLRMTDAESLTSIVLSPAAFLKDDDQGILYTFLNLFNPFAVWGVVIMVIGTAAMTQRPVAKVAPYILIGWLVLGTLLGMI